MDIVTVQDYRDLTGDSLTSDGTVSARLEVAVGLVNEGTQRFLQLDTYTEKLAMHAGWLVYPSGVPLQSVVSPSAAQPMFGGYALGGADATFWWDPVVGPIDWWLVDPFAEVTYVGGYTYATLPVGLRLIICDIAFALGSRSPVLTGAAVQSAGVSDVSVSYVSGGTGGGAVDSILPGTSKRLGPFRRPTA